MTIFTPFFSLSWLQILNLLALLQNKNTWIGPFPRKRSVLQNPDRERTNQSTGICLELGLPYNKTLYFLELLTEVFTLESTFTQLGEIRIGKKVDHLLNFWSFDLFLSV